MAKKKKRETTTHPSNKKKRPNKYESKLAITGTLDDVLRASVPKK